MKPTEAALLEISIADVAAKLPSQIWANPLIPFDDFCHYVLALPVSTCELLVKQGNWPPMFTLGRRRYIKTVDARKWIDQHAKDHPHVPRKNAKRAGGDA